MLSSFCFSEKESIHIPAGTAHRVENPGVIPMIMIEVQVGSYLSEDDIVRLDDMYGRASDARAAPRCHGNSARKPGRTQLLMTTSHGSRPFAKPELPSVWTTQPGTMVVPSPSS